MKPEIKQTNVSTKELLPFIIDQLSEEKQVRLTVTGNSMMPLLRGGRDGVLLAPVETPKKYDIVLYVRKDGEVILHRIVKITKEGYMILGDNQTQVDGPIPKEQIIAVVAGIYRDSVLYDRSLWWYKLYGRLWVNAGPCRRLLFPLAVFFGKMIKHSKRAGK